MLILGVFCGCGIATFSVGVSQVSYWHPQARQGSALGIYADVGNLAPGLFTFLLPQAIALWGLSGAYLAWFGFLMVGIVLYAALADNSRYFQLLKMGFPPDQARRMAAEAGQQVFPATSVRESLWISASNWKTWILVAVYFGTFGGFIALTAWLPTYWREFFALSVGRAGALAAAYSILASLMRVAGGLVSDRLGGETTAWLALAAMLLGAILVCAADDFTLALSGEILLAVGMGAANGAVFKLVPRDVPEAVGGAAGWVGGLGALGGFVLPPVLGIIARVYGRDGYARGFLIFAGLALLAMLLVTVLRWAHLAETRPAFVPLPSPKTLEGAAR